MPENFTINQLQILCICEENFEYENNQQHTTFFIPKALVAQEVLDQLEGQEPLVEQVALVELEPLVGQEVQEVKHHQFPVHSL